MDDDKKEKAREANRRYRQKIKDALNAKETTEKIIASQLTEINAQLKQLLNRQTRKTRKINNE